MQNPKRQQQVWLQYPPDLCLNLRRSRWLHLLFSHPPLWRWWCSSFPQWYLEESFSYVWIQFKFVVWQIQKALAQKILAVPWASPWIPATRCSPLVAPWYRMHSRSLWCRLSIVFPSPSDKVPANWHKEARNIALKIYWSTKLHAWHPWLWIKILQVDTH